MTAYITIQAKGIDQAITGLRRANQAAPGAQREVIRALGEKHVAKLREAAPLGKGEDPGQLRAGFALEHIQNGVTVGYRITNDVPHLKYVLKGRGPVTVKRAKALRFVISGRVFFRRSVGPAAANRFDQKVRAQMQPEIRAAGLNIRTRIVGAYKGA